MMAGETISELVLGTGFSINHSFITDNNLHGVKGILVANLTANFRA